MAGDTFVQPPQGWVVAGCASIVLVVPVIGAALALSDVPLVAVPLCSAFLLLPLSLYLRGNEELRLDLESEKLSLTRTRILFGARLSSKVEWEIPNSNLNSAMEVRTRKPAGTDWKTELHLPDGRIIDAHTLGGSENKHSTYNQFVRVLEQRLGPAFERENREEST